MQLRVRSKLLAVVRPRAFTLIELVSVIVILGIVSLAIAVPTMSYLASVRSRAAAARLAGDLRYMQRLALNSGLQTWVLFTSVSGNYQYQLYIEDPSNPGWAGRQAEADPLDLSTAAIQFGTGVYAGVTISAANINSTTRLGFDSFGVPYDGNDAALSSAATITLSSGVTVTVQPVSGFVERAG